MILPFIDDKGVPEVAILTTRSTSALDKVYYDDFCGLSRWAQSVKATDGKIDFNN